MATVCFSERAACLMLLGDIDAAADAYEEALRRARERDDTRDVAANSLGLGTVRLYQERYAEALAGFEAARATFERLSEPASVAGAWHQRRMSDNERLT
jgi:tetratricopeptide (TPR) repeat protein